MAALEPPRLAGSFHDPARLGGEVRLIVGALSRRCAVPGVPELRQFDPDLVTVALTPNLLDVELPAFVLGAVMVGTRDRCRERFSSPVPIALGRGSSAGSGAIYPHAAQREGPSATAN